MRVPLAWLRDHVDLELDAESLAERLTVLGMEVQGIEAWGAEWQGVVVGELLAVEPHPRADRLSLTKVTVGTGETLDIVCGATNIAPGQRVPVALPGAVLPGGRRIERTEKMGVASNGMLCSGDELRLTGDDDGILILPAETRLGASLVDLYGDTVLDVDVKPNRGDALSIVGLAREVAALTGARIRFPDTDPPESGRPVGHLLTVRVEEPELCTRFVGRHVTDVRVGPSPDRIQMRLRAAGQRPVSNVVDASNYVMLELGKPIHTFDATAVHEGLIVVRLAREGERLETLDHVDRELHPETLLIADEQGPLAIAGVMGGSSSEVGDATTDIVIESAIFDQVSIRRTAFRYGLRSEASLRFEKGQENRLARLGADRTARLIAEWAGGTVAVGRVDTAPSEPEAARVAFRPGRVNRLLGTRLATYEQRDLLARVGIFTEGAKDGVRIPVAAAPRPLDVGAGDAEALVAVVPTWRRDLAIEADIIEEVVRVRGYDAVPEFLPETAMPSYRRSPLEVRDAIRSALVGAGLDEVVTMALTSHEAIDTFGPRDDGYPTGEPESRAGGRPVTVTNPLASQHSVMRQSLVGNLLEVVATNVRHGRDDVAIFEVGKGYGVTDQGATHEWWRLGFALTGSSRDSAWDRAGEPCDLGDAKGIIDLIAQRIGSVAPTYELLRDDPLLHPGRSARIAGTDRMAGRVGEVHPTVVARLDLRAERIVVAELAIAGLGGGRLEDARGGTPPRHPAAGRDIAVVVADERSAASVAASIRRHGGDLLGTVRLFDIYRGRPLADDEKSLAYHLEFLAPDRTLTEDEVEKSLAAITVGMARDIGGRLRT